MGLAPLGSYGTRDAPSVTSPSRSGTRSSLGRRNLVGWSHACCASACLTGRARARGRRQRHRGGTRRRGSDRDPDPGRRACHDPADGRAVDEIALDVDRDLLPLLLAETEQVDESQSLR